MTTMRAGISGLEEKIEEYVSHVEQKKHLDGINHDSSAIMRFILAGSH